jgi:hypothetical protein
MDKLEARRAGLSDLLTQMQDFKVQEHCETSKGVANFLHGELQKFIKLKEDSCDNFEEAIRIADLFKCAEKDLRLTTADFKTPHVNDSATELISQYSLHQIVLHVRGSLNRIVRGPEIIESLSALSELLRDTAKHVGSQQVHHLYTENEYPHLHSVKELSKKTFESTLDALKAIDAMIKNLGSLFKDSVHDSIEYLKSGETETLLQRVNMRKYIEETITKLSAARDKLFELTS